MIDFTVLEAEPGFYRVMVSRDQQMSKQWRFYVADITSVFKQLAEAMNADITRLGSVSSFLIAYNELWDLQELVLSHGCSLQLSQYKTVTQLTTQLKP